MEGGVRHLLPRAAALGGARSERPSLGFPLRVEGVAQEDGKRLHHHGGRVHLGGGVRDVESSPAEEGERATKIVAIKIPIDIFSEKFI